MREKRERKKEVEKESEKDMERGREEEKNQPSILPASCMDKIEKKKKAQEIAKHCGKSLPLTISSATPLMSPRICLQ